tara:strand:- start:216 stop:443 length:228 start_codon:yes stop_codon:yes gene_type:complete
MGTTMKQKEFLEIEGATTAKPLRTEAGEMLGWVVSRNGVTLERNRGGIRTFKALCSVSKFCTDHKIDGFSVKGLS